MRVKSHQPDPTTTTTDDDESGERSVILGWEEADIKPDDVYNDDGSSRGNNEDDSDDTSTSSGSSSELPIFVPPGHPSAPALSSNRPRPSPSRPHHHQPHSLSHPRHPPHHHTHHQHLRQPQSAGSRPIAGAALTPERPPRPPTAPRVRHQEAPSIIHAIPPFNDSFPTLSFSASTTTETSGLPTYNADYVAVLLRQIELLKVERKEADLTQAARLRSAEAQIRDLKEKNRQLRHENENLRGENEELAFAKVERIPDRPAAKASKSSTDSEGLSFPVLKENVRLRQECRKLRSALRDLGHLAADSEDRGPDSTDPEDTYDLPSTPPIGRILVKAPAILRADHFTQTDTMPDAAQAGQSKQIETLKIKLADHESVCKEHMQELESVNFLLQDTQNRLRAMRTDHTRATTTAEKATASEETLRKTIEEQRALLKKYEDQLLELNAEAGSHKQQATRIRMEYDQYRQAQGVLEAESQKSIQHLKDLLQKVLERHAASKKEQDREGVAWVGRELQNQQKRHSEEMLFLQKQLTDLVGEKQEMERTLCNTDVITKLQQELMKLKINRKSAIHDLELMETELKDKSAQIRTLEESAQHLADERDNYLKSFRKQEVHLSKSRAELNRKTELLKELKVSLEGMTDANKTLEQKYRALQTANASKDATVNNLKQRQDELDSRLSRITQENEAQLEARVKEVAKKWRNDLKRKEEIAQHWRTRHDEALKEVETLKERISSSVTAKQHSHALESLRSAMNRVDASERKLAAMHTRTHHLEKALKTAVEGLVSARRVRALDAARFQIPTVVQSGVPVDPALEMAVEQKAREISQRIFNVDYDSFMAPDLSTSQDSGVDLHYSTDSNERKRYALTRLDQIMRSSDSGDELCDFLNELTTD